MQMPCIFQEKRNSMLLRGETVEIMPFPCFDHGLMASRQTLAGVVGRTKMVMAIDDRFLLQVVFLDHPGITREDRAGDVSDYFIFLNI
jgi:hypothetical protein